MPSRADAGGAVSIDVETGSPLSNAGGADDVSENAIKPRWLIALALEVPRGVYREIEDRLREEVAAAEERGRRRGVEAAAEWLSGEWKRVRDASLAAEVADEMRAALAPRDSAPVTANDVAASCFGVAPRDSGKEKT